MAFRHSTLLFSLVVTIFNSTAGKAVAQAVASPVVQQPGTPTRTEAPSAAEDKRIFGVLPNYRTAEMSAQTKPLTPKQKLRIAVKDSFDYPLMAISAVYAGLYQAEDNHPQFGQGAKGYFSRLGTSYADQVDGNMLTEGFLPILFREDPRYFRMSEGPKKKRLVYALSRIVITRTDSGHASFNFAEVLGNGISSGIGLTYYSDSRDPRSYMENWATQLGTDALSQVLKEFWPDLKRHFAAKRKKTQ